MGWSLSLAVYFIIWWILLFAVLPFGVRTQSEDGEVVPGTPASAPTRPRLLKVVLWNTVLSALVFAVVWAVVTYRLIGLSDIPIGPG